MQRSHEQNRDPLSTPPRYGSVSHLDDHRRGVFYAGLVIPLTIVAWLFLWQFDLITSIVGWLTASMAVRLYRYGSGWLPARRGAVAVLIVVSTAIIAAQAATLLFDGARTFLNEYGASMLVIGPAVVDPGFGAWMPDVYLTQQEVWAAWLLNLAIALLFSLLGVAPTLVRAFRGERAGSRLSVFLIPLTVVLGVLGLWSFLVVPVGGPSEAATTEPYVVGDCLPVAVTVTEESLLDRPVACDEPHAAEVVFAGRVDDVATDGIYPGDEFLVEYIAPLCAEAFAAVIGVPMEQSALATQSHYPSLSSWTYYGDRDVACAAVDPVGPVTGSLAGAAR
jgi:hypothetical protein